ncbi:hypothetical protein AMELA_G00216900 [Ameiurus melas]|uniref:Uncharacterized protein n=1 Tax=Ameiurus melas TaxID=219545 RepID=A0A7J6A1I3_AMEME|nr:hypothetical protein AMELA_G00216900 [Ameiurus melas]
MTLEELLQEPWIRQPINLAEYSWSEVFPCNHDSSEQNRYNPDVPQEASAHGGTDETSLQEDDDDDEMEEDEDKEQRRTLAALEFELLKYLIKD